LVGTAACYIRGCSGYTIHTCSGVNVSTAEENTIDGVGGSETHDGGVVISAALGGVADKSGEEDIEISIQYCIVAGFIGFVVWTVNIIVIWIC
jgi:hypothetical protein